MQPGFRLKGQYNLPDPAFPHGDVMQAACAVFRAVLAGRIGVRSRTLPQLHEGRLCSGTRDAPLFYWWPLRPLGDLLFRQTFSSACEQCGNSIEFRLPSGASHSFHPSGLDYGHLTKHYQLHPDSWLHSQISPIFFGITNTRFGRRRLLTLRESKLLQWCLLRQTKVMPAMNSSMTTALDMGRRLVLCSCPLARVAR